MNLDEYLISIVDKFFGAISGCGQRAQQQVNSNYISIFNSIYIYILVVDIKL